MGLRTNTAVWMEKYQRWQIKVQKDGDRRTFYCSTPGRTGQRECNRKADAWLDGGIVAGDLKVSRLFEDWLEELKLTTGHSHWRQYDSIWNNWIKGSIGRLHISRVTEQHLQTIINKAHAAGRSKKHLRNMRACMAAFMKYCRKRKATLLLVESVSIPRGAPVGERTVLQPKDIAVLFTQDETTFQGKLTSEPFVNAYRFQVATGLRPGEVVGLMWSDIENNQYVHLQRSINVSSEVTTGKNENARRTFALTPISSDILQAQRSWLLSTGIRSDYVFPDTDGGPIRQRIYYTHWVNYREHNGISKVSPYELRHTFVSVVKTMPEGLLKPLVGHSVDMDTYSTYSHEITGDLERTADLVQAFFQKILNADDKEDASSV